MKSGIYRVVTAASTYIIDLDRKELTRTPNGEESVSAQLRRDNQTVSLVEIVIVRVGSPMLLLINLHVPGVEMTTRRTTMVQSIEELAQPDTEVAA